MGPGNEETQEQSVEGYAFNLIKNAFDTLKDAPQKSREHSLVLTKLEEAMMWLNKDRTIKGQLQSYPGTHVQQ